MRKPFAAGSSIPMPMCLMAPASSAPLKPAAPISQKPTGPIGSLPNGSYTENYDWGWFHGYLAAGFMQLTTRNDFHTHPEPEFRYFGDGIDENRGFPHWTDAKTPPKTDRIKIFSGRERDFYWTLNQAAHRATRTSENTLNIEFGHTQPFFDHYLVTIDDTSHAQTEDPYRWTLHKGENMLAVAPVNEWGVRGIESYLTIRY